MKKFAFLSLFALCCTFTMTGCGSPEAEVVGVPEDATEEQPAMEGMTDEEYNKAMEEEMNN